MSVDQLVPRIQAEYREMVVDLEDALTTGVDGKRHPRLLASSRAAQALLGFGSW